MLNRMRLRRSFEGNAHNLQATPVFPLPRLWMVLLVLVVPFFFVCADCLESLERSGPFGAVVAPPLLPALLIGYSALLLALRQRKL